MSSSTPMGPGDAKKMVRVAQLGALALGVSAAALWALGVPGLGSGTLPVPSAIGTEPDAPQQSGAAPTRVAFTSELAVDVAKRLDEARIKAPTPEPSTPTPDPTPPPTPEPPTQEPTDWRYIGTIKEPGRTLAVVSIEGQGQVIVPEGRRVGKTELVEIRQDAITVREGEVEREIPRAERVSSVVGWLKLPTYQAPAGLGAVPAAGVPGGQPGFSAEQIARMRERGIDPAQAQRMRELMREGRGRRGGPDGGTRGGGRTDEVRRMQEMGEERN